ncbi:MAG: ABC transporter substrate-binding protein [Candidatus Poribacteria bacterium]|nr:ABC transporter substrate-binding protein [Candidatus Poribacteria bacterium]
MNVRRIKIYAYLLSTVFLMAGLSACDQLQQLLTPAPPQMEELDGEIPVGVVLSITGRFASTFGNPNEKGLELALEEVNNSKLGDRSIKLIIEDDQSTVEGAVEAYNKLIEQDGVPVILGPATSSQAKAAFPIAQENQVVAFSPSSAARGLSAIGDFIFRAALTTEVLIPSGIEATLATLGYKTAATFYDESDVFSTDSDEAVREALAANSVEVLLTETFRGGDTDFSEQLSRIRDANPDIIFISSLSPEKPGILMQGRQLGIPDSVPFVVRTLTTADVSAAGDAAEGAITFVGWASTADTPGNSAFVQNYSAKYGEEPSNYTARWYAGLHILAEAIANAQSTDSTAIRDGLANITDFDTVFGKFSFDAVGDAIYDPKILIVMNGQLVIFE